MADPLEPRQCTAKSKRSGERCRRAPIIGGNVCATHGGMAPQVKAKAAENVQQEAAENELRNLWVGLKDARLVEDPVESMARLAGGLEQMLDVVGAKVNEITNVAAGSSMGQIRGELVLLERVASLLARLLDAMARLGIEERKVKFQQDQAAALVAAYRVGLAAIPSSVLSPGDLELMAGAYLRALGWEPAALEAGPVLA